MDAHLLSLPHTTMSMSCARFQSNIIDGLDKKLSFVILYQNPTVSSADVKRSESDAMFVNFYLCVTVMK